MEAGRLVTLHNACSRILEFNLYLTVYFLWVSFPAYVQQDMNDGLPTFDGFPPM